MATAELNIESIAAGGDGVARDEGLVVFVPRTAPGDVALVEWFGHGRFARGKVRKLVAASSTRVDPVCEHYVRERCGGCQLQHMEYGAQLEAKSRIIRDALLRIGKRDVPLPTVVASDDQWRYRRKLTLAMRRQGGQWLAGLHPYDAPGHVFQLGDCPITHEAVLSAWREVMSAAAELPRAAELRGAVRLGDTGTSFTLEGGVSWPRVARFFERTPSLTTLWWLRDGAERPVLLKQRATEEQAGGDAVGEAPDTAHSPGLIAPARRPSDEDSDEAPGASFEQVNAGVAVAVRAYVAERVAAHSPATVIDAYAGLGDLAVALASPECRVTAIELDEDAAAWCARRLPGDSRAVAARVEHALPEYLPADVVILNPPRGGVDQRVTDELQNGAGSTRAIVYVSCNPATLARDLTRLPRWRIASLLAFDMFPQTAHVETVCELVPEAA